MVPAIPPAPRDFCSLRSGRPGSLVLCGTSQAPPGSLNCMQPDARAHPARCPQADRGKLLLWGSLGRPVDSGMLIWRNADEAEVQGFVKGDPFVVNGLVRHW